jgi:DNA-damage-inducible protein J
MSHNLLYYAETSKGERRMAKTAVINIRTEPEIKSQAENLYRSMGVSLSDAINMFLYKSIDFRGLPFDLCREIPNEETIAAMKEAEDIISGKIPSKSYSSFTDMLNDALADDTGE